jgi:hypothetical protein
MNLVTVSTDFAHFPGNVKGQSPGRGMSKRGWFIYIFYAKKFRARSEDTSKS